jgi:hypothetical protein
MTVPRTCPGVAWGVLALALGLAGCSSPALPSHYTRLWPAGRTGQPLVGTSTEDGVVILSTPGLALGDRYEIQFPFGNSVVADWGLVDRLNDVLAVVRPQTAVLREGRIASSPPTPDEQLYLALRDDRDEPALRPVARWRRGEYGDWVILRGVDPDEVARSQRGTGVYVRREVRWEIVGVLAGLTAVDEVDVRGEVALGFIGLRELARILPDRVAYFERDEHILRPDFEFGVPLQPGDLERRLPQPAPGAGPAPGGKLPKAPVPGPKPPAPR